MTLDEVSVSVIIPAHGEGLRKDTLESAVREVGGIEGEVVLVDDGLSCALRDLVARLGEHIRVIRTHGNEGPASARTLGLRAARGCFVKFLDHDDLLESGSLKDELSLAIESRADVVVADWGEAPLDGPDSGDGGVRISPAAEFASPVDDILAGRAVPTGAALYRRRHVIDLAWDPRIVKLDDWDWFCTVALKEGTRIVRKNGVSYWWRRHRGQISARATTSRIIVDFYAILDKLETTLRSTGRLTPRRALRLAQYNYKMLRMLALEDWSRFEVRMAHIERLDPGFRPLDEETSKALRLAARIVGTKWMICLYVHVFHLRRRLCGR